MTVNKPIIIAPIDNYWANDYDTRLNYNPTDIFGVDFSQGYHLDRYRLPGGISIDADQFRRADGCRPGKYLIMGRHRILILMLPRI